MRRQIRRGCDTVDYKSVFRRYELKYLMDVEQADAVLDALERHMELDRFGLSTIRNIYFDTPNYLLARNSIARPIFKEKLRFRSYGVPSKEDVIFVELKKKYDSVVYKRRLAMPLGDAMDWFCANGEGPDTQIGEEIGYIKVRYPDIRPAMFLSYDREAYRSKDDDDLRITIDRNILARTEDLDLSSETGGCPVLPEGYILMEIKTMYGYPDWLTSVLSSNHLYKSRFSKYGNAYKEMVLGKVPEEYLSILGGEKATAQRTVTAEGSV